MDVTMSILTGGGRKANRMSHHMTLKEVTTFDEAMEVFRKEFAAFFPPQMTLVEVTPRKRTRKEPVPEDTEA